MPKVNDLQQFILMERQQRNNLAAFNLLVKKDDPIEELRGYLNDNNNRSNIFHIDDLKYGQPTDADLTLMTSRLELLQTSFDDLSIPKPFKNSSEEVDIELKFIRMLRKLSEDPETTRNIDEEDKDLLVPFLRFAKTHSLPVDESFLRLLLHDVNALTIRFKYMFNRPRPKQLAAQKKLELVAHEGESANIPSYPSGHSVAGRVIGKALGDRYPSFAEGFEKIGAAIGLHRLIAGLHYPTDHAAGVMLGDQIYSKGLINDYTNFMMPESEDLVRAVQQAVAKHAEGFNLNKSIDDIGVLVDIFKADDRSVTVHSGGADGSDDEWAKAFPDEVIGHSFEGHNMFNRTNPKIWDDDRLEQNFQKYLDAYSWIKSNGDPGRYQVSNDKTKKLMGRNWEQVRNSDAVIGIIEELIGNAPTGGTSYAVAMGIQKGIPVHVFNQSTNNWLTWNPRDNKWDGTSLNDIPHYKSFAGVGSRKLGAKGKAAIQAYAGKLKTFQKGTEPFFTPGTAPNQQFGSKVSNRPEPVDDGLRHIYVFGSNSLGVHGNGTALIAVKHHGARYNQSWPKDLQALNAEGIQGELDTAGSYALITKKEPYITYSREQLTEPTGTVRNSIRTFIKFAIENSTMVNSDGVEQKVVYHIADVGTNPRGAGFKPEEVAKVFREETSPTRLAALARLAAEGRVSVEGGEVGTVTLTDAEREKRRTVAAAIAGSLSGDATDKVFIFGNRLADALGIEYSDEDYNNYGIRGRVGDSIQHPKYDAGVEKIERDRAAEEKKPKTVEQLKQEEHLKKRIARANASLSRFATDENITVHQVGEARQGYSPEQEIRDEPDQFERGGQSLSDQVSDLQQELEDFIERNYDPSRWLFIDNSTYKRVLGIGRQTIKPGESKGEIKPEKIKGTVFDTEIEDVAQQIAMHTVLGSRVGDRGMLHIAQRPSNTQVMNFLNRKINSGDEEERIDMEPILNAEDVTLDHIIEYMTIPRTADDKEYNTDPYQVLAEDVSLHPVQDAPGEYNLSFTAANYALGNPWNKNNPAGSIAYDFDTGIISTLIELARRGDKGGRDIADTVENLITDIRSLLTSGEGLEGLRELKDQVAEVAHDKIGDQKSNWPTAGVSERAQVDSALDDLMNSTTYEERIEAYRQEEELDLAEVTVKFLEDFKKDINLLAIGTEAEEQEGKSQRAVFQKGLLDPKFNFDREALKRLLMFSSLYGAYNPSKQSFTQNNIAGNVRKNLGALMKQVRERWESENKAARPPMGRPRSIEDLEKEQLERQTEDGVKLEAEKGERADLRQEWDDHTEAWETFNARPTLSDTNSEINKLLFNSEWWGSKKGKANKDNRKIWTDLFLVEPIKDVETRFPELQRNFLARLDAIQKRMSEGYYDAKKDTWPGSFTLGDAELFGELLGFPGITEAFKATGVNAVAGDVNSAVLAFVHPGNQKGQAKAHPEFREIFAGFGTPLTKVREQSFIDEIEDWEIPGVDGYEALLESGALNEETIKAMNRNADAKVVEEILKRASANDTLRNSGVDDINSLITYTASAFKGNQFKQVAGSEEHGEAKTTITPFFANPPIHAPRLQRYSVDEQQAHRIIDAQLDNYFNVIFKDGTLLSNEERYGTVDETTGGERRYTSGDAEGMLVEPQRDISRISGKIESTVEQQLDDLRNEIFGPGETVEETLDRSYNDLVDSGEVDEETGKMIQIPRSDLFLREAKKLLLRVADKKGVPFAHLDTTPGLQILLAGTPEARKQLAEDREKILEELDTVPRTKKEFEVGGVPKTTVAGAEAKLRTSAGEVDTFYYHDPASLVPQRGEPTPDITPDEILEDVERMQSYATVPESDIRGLKELATSQISEEQLKEWITRTFGSQDEDHRAFIEVIRRLNAGEMTRKEAGALLAKRANEFREKVLPVIQDVETEQQIPMFGEGEHTEPTGAMREQHRDEERKANEARIARWGTTEGVPLDVGYRYGQVTKWPHPTQRSNTASSAMKDPTSDVDLAVLRSEHPFRRAKPVELYNIETKKRVGTYEQMSQQEKPEGTENAP